MKTKPAASGAGGAAQTANHWRFNVGDIECIALREGHFEGPVEAIAIDTPKTEFEAFLNARGALAEAAVTPLQVLLVRLPSGLNVLIDTGTGPDFPIGEAGKLLASMQAAGVAPEAIDHILISHLHHDHINGVFDQSGRAVFPNASCHVSAEEIAFWQNPATDLGGSRMPPPLKQHVLDDARRFLHLSHGKRQTFHAGAEVIPGVKTVPLPGHTPGQVGFLFESRGESLLYIADAASNCFVSLQRPDWRLQNDDDAPTATATRKHLTRMVREKNWTVFAPHFPWPGVGHVVEENGQAIFKPM